MATDFPQGLKADPRLLAAAAAGCAAVALALWGFRGLPLGTLVFWLAPLPLFLAGLGFGPAMAWSAMGLATLGLLLTVGTAGAAVFAVSAGLPVGLMVSAALAGSNPSLETARPLALLGLWPAAAAVLALGLGPDGLEEILRAEVGEALARSGMETGPDAIAPVVRVALAMAAAGLLLPLLLCGIGAQRWLARRGLALRDTPRWRAARLPRGYAVLPVLALILVWVGPGTGAVGPAVATALWAPLFLQGLAVLHGRLRGVPLALFYAVLVVLFVPTAAVVAAIGLFEPFGRPGASGAPPRH